MGLRKKFSLLVTKLEMSMHTHTPTTTAHTDTHTQTRTAVHTNAPTPAYTPAPTPTCTKSSAHAHTAVPTVEQLHLLVQQLSRENSSLKREVAELTRRCNDLESEVDNVTLQLAQFTTAPRLLAHHTTLRRGWHEQANDIIGASHSRASPTHEYKCAHAKCNWRNKVTLHAYVLHLKRKHGENISDNPDLSLLPVLSR